MRNVVRRETYADFHVLLHANQVAVRLGNYCKVLRRLRQYASAASRCARIAKAALQYGAGAAALSPTRQNSFAEYALDRFAMGWLCSPSTQHSTSNLNHVE